MATEAPACPSCADPLGTPVNTECGVERGRWDGLPNANLFCPACGTGWVGTDVDVANAWRAFVEHEQTQVPIGPCVSGCRPKCKLCGRRKKPVGRDSMDNGLCDQDCSGYRDDPKPCDLWPGEMRPGFCEGCREADPTVKRREYTGGPDGDFCDGCVQDWMDAQRENVPR